MCFTTVGSGLQRHVAPGLLQQGSQLRRNVVEAGPAWWGQHAEIRQPDLIISRTPSFPMRHLPVGGVLSPAPLHQRHIRAQALEHGGVGPRQLLAWRDGQPATLADGRHDLRRRTEVGQGGKRGTASLKWMQARLVPAITPATGWLAPHCSAMGTRE